MKRACALLGIKLVYARPRNPQGKGKQERFNETADQFLAECSLEEITSLKDLNEKFQPVLHQGNSQRHWNHAGDCIQVRLHAPALY